MRNGLILASVVAIAVLLGCLGGGGGGGGGSPAAITPSGVMLSGRVYFADRALYGAIPVLVRDMTGKIAASTKTDGTGQFAFSSLTPGLYDISATTGEAEVIFESGVQITAQTQKAIGDKSLLALKTVIIDQITSSSLRLAFTTNQACTSQLEYGTSLDVTPTKISVNTSFVTSHQVILSGLTAGTRYGLTLALLSQEAQQFRYPGLYSTTARAAGPSQLALSIEAGAFETTKTQVTVTPAAQNATEMRIGETEDLSDATWEAYSVTKNYTFSGADGTRRLYAQFRDASGNSSSIINDAILLTTTTTGYLGVWINRGAQLTNKLDAVLTVLFPGATQMRISSRRDFFSSFWEAYTEARKWTLATGDGTKTVFVQFNGGGANPDQIFSTSIVLDTTGPEVSMMINGGAIKTNNQRVTLTFTSTSNPYQMQVANDAAFVDNPPWKAFTTSLPWVLSETDGKKSIYAKFQDTLGNLYGPITANITLDTLPPESPSFKINSGSATTTTILVRLTDITAKDATKMTISNTEDFTGATPESFKTIRNWALGGYGIQSVYMTFTDDASNTTSPVVQSIDNTGEPVGDNWVNINGGDAVTYAASVTADVYSPTAVRFRIAENPTFSGEPDRAYNVTPGLSFVRVTDFSLSKKAGRKTIIARFESASGTYSLASDSIETIGPSSYTLAVNDAQPLSTFTVNLRPFALNAEEMLLTEDYAQVDNTALWQPFAYNTAYVLSPASGKHTIYAKYRNKGRVETEIMSVDVLAFTPSASQPYMIINGGDSETRTASVTLFVFAPQQNEVRFSNDNDFSAASPRVPPPAQQPWIIKNRAGVQTVHARFLNASGTFSYASDTILAVGPASISISTLDPQPLNTLKVNLILGAEGAVGMLVTDNVASLTASASWVPYQTPYVTALSAGGGNRTIYAKFRNANTDWIETDQVTLGIQVRNTPPVGDSVAIRKSESPTSEEVATTAHDLMPVYLHFATPDTNTATIAWQLTPPGAIAPTTFRQLAAPALPIPLTPFDFPASGTYSFWYRFSDGVGNTTPLTYKTLTVAVRYASPAILINDGDLQTQTASVTLHISAPNTVRAWFANTPNFTGVTPDAPVPTYRSWKITPRSGDQTVYARFADSFGNFTFANDVITAVGPTNASLSTSDVQPLNRTTVNLAISANNALDMLLSENPAAMDATTGWASFTRNLVFPFTPTGGVHTIYAKFRNTAPDAIETLATPLNVTLRNTPPAGNEVSFRFAVSSSSSEIASITIASLPCYLHFNVAASDTTAMYWQIASMGAGQPPVLGNIATPPIQPIPLNSGYFPAEGFYSVWYRSVDGIGNTTLPAFKSIEVRNLAVSRSYYIDINDGDTTTGSPAVALKIFSPDAVRYRVALDSSFSSVPDNPYTPVPPNDFIVINNYSLPRKAGLKTVFVRFESNGGLFTTAQDSIQLAGPINTSIISSDTQPLATFSVNLRLFAESATQMLLTEDYSQIDSPLAWEPIAFSKAFPLRPFSGGHRIYGKFRSADLVESDVMTVDVVASVTFSNSVEINNGDDATSSSTVSLRIKSNDAVRFRVSLTNSFTTAPQYNYTPAPGTSYVDVPSLQLARVAGIQTVYVRVETASGAFAVAQDSIQVLGPTTPSVTALDVLPVSTFSVNLRTSAGNANEMFLTEDIGLVSNPPAWSPYSSTTRFDLLPFSGSHRIYAKFRTSDLIESDLQSLDVVASVSLTPTVEINDGDATTPSLVARLKLSSPGAVRYRTSLDSSFAFSTDFAFAPIEADGSVIGAATLAVTQGLQTVYVRFENASGALTTAQDSITVSGPVNPSMTTTDAQPLSTYSVNLKLFAENATGMLLTETFTDLATTSPWPAFAFTKAFPLQSYGGSHRIYGKFRTSQGVETSVLTLDVVASISYSNTVVINDDDASTASSTVNLKVTSTNASSFSVSLTNSFGTATEIAYLPLPGETFVRVNNFPIARQAGVQTVYVRFRSAAGDLTTAQDLIQVLGPTSPLLSSPDSQPLASFTVNLRHSATTAAEMIITEDSDRLNTGPWDPIASSSVLNLLPYTGTHRIYGKFRNAGRVESDLVTLDVTIATLPFSITINDGDSFTTASVATLTLFAANTRFYRLATQSAFAGVPDVPYVANATGGRVVVPGYLLSRKPGTPTVYVRFEQNDGTLLYTNDSIQVVGPTSLALTSSDTQPLATATVNLRLGADTATEMILTYLYDDLATTTWSTFQATATKSLAPVAGWQTVYARFRNAGMVETDPISLNVQVAGTVSTRPSLVINGGDATTNDVNLSLTLDSPDSVVGVHKRTLSDTGNFTGIASQPYLKSEIWPIVSKVAGAKTVWVRYETPSGYVDASDSITLVGPASVSLSTPDTQPLNQGYVNLRFLAQGATAMRYSLDIDDVVDPLKPWYSFAASGTLPLPGGGTHTVYAKYRNAGSVETDVLSLVVTVRSVAPTGNQAAFRESYLTTSTEVSTTQVGSLPVYLHFTIGDANTDSIAYAVTPDSQTTPPPWPAGFTLASTSVAPIPFDESSPPAFPLQKLVNYLWYRFSDGAGNWSSISVKSLNLKGPGIRVSPTMASMFSNQTKTFTASLENISGTVNWHILSGPGNIDTTTGLFTAPAIITTPATTSIEAFLTDNASVKATATISLLTQVELFWDRTEANSELSQVSTFSARVLNSASGVVVVSVTPNVGTYSYVGPTALINGSSAMNLFYTAPATMPTPPKVTLQVSSVQDPTKFTNLVVNLSSGPVINIFPGSDNAQARIRNVTISATTSNPGSIIDWRIVPANSSGSFQFPASTAVIVTTTVFPAHSVTFYPSDRAGVAYVVASWTNSTAVIPPTATTTITIAQAVEMSQIYPAATSAAAVVSPIQFSHTMNYAPTTQVDWEFRNAGPPAGTWQAANGLNYADKGTLTTAGLYTRPAGIPTEGSTIEIRVKSRDDPTASKTAIVTLLPPVQVAIDKGYTFIAPLASADVLLEVGTLRLIASVTFAPTTSVTWHVNGTLGGDAVYGTIASTGVYTAPADKPSPSTIEIRAYSTYDATKYASISVTLQDFWEPQSKNLKNVTNATCSVYALLFDPTTASTADRLAFCGTHGQGAFWTTVDQTATGTDWPSIDWKLSNLATTTVNGSGVYVVNDLAISAAHPERVVAVTDGGAFQSQDGGKTYSQITVPGNRPCPGGNYDTGFTNVFSKVVIDPTDDSYLYLLGRDQGILRCRWIGAGPYTYSGTIWDDKQIYTIRNTFDDKYQDVDASGTVTDKVWTARDSMYLHGASGTVELTCMAINPLNPSTMYVGFRNFHRTDSPTDLQNGYLVVHNIRSGEYLFKAANNFYPYDVDASIVATEPIQFAETLRLINITGIITYDTGTPLSVILSIAPDPNTSTTIWMGKDNGVYRTTNGGLNWTQFGGSYVNVRDILVDPINTINVFIGTENGLFFTRNAGGSWTRVKSGLEGHTTINSFDLSPGGVGLRRIIVGTTGGAFVGRTTLDLE